jgi:hypothetical protein
MPSASPAANGHASRKPLRNGMREMEWKMRDTISALVVPVGVLGHRYQRLSSLHDGARVFEVTHLHLFMLVQSQRGNSRTA